MVDHEELPETGAVLTFGRSRFNENEASQFWIKNDPILACSCGDEHTVVIAESHRVFAFGSNEFGQLGLGHTKSVTRPSCVKALKSARCRVVGCGKSHTVVGTDDGKLFAFGLNQDGQLGLGHTETTFDQVTEWNGGRVVQLDAGVAHTAALTADGRLFAWGSNEDGQCGLGDAPGACLPTPVPSDDEIVNFSCGYRHTAFVSAGGDLYVFGENDDGQLGLGDRETRSRPTLVPKLRSVAKVACGGQYTVVLTESGDVWCFGGGGQGQLGLGTRLLTALTPRILSLGPVRARDVAAGHCHSAIVTDDHQLLMFGDSRHGKLCSGEEESNVFVPQPAEQLQQLHVSKAVLGGCQTMVLVERLTSPERRRTQPLITNGLPASSDDVHSSARQRRREREMALPGRGRTLPPLKGAPRTYQSPTEHDGEIQPSSGRKPPGDSGDLQADRSPVELKDEQSMPSSSGAQDETHDDDGVKTGKKKEGSTLSRLLRKFQRKKSEATEKEKEDDNETEKDPADDESQPEGRIQRVLPVEGGDADEGDDRPDNPSPTSDHQPAATAATPPLPPPPADTAATAEQQPATEQKTPEEQNKKKKKKKFMSKTCEIL